MRTSTLYDEKTRHLRQAGGGALTWLVAVLVIGLAAVFIWSELTAAPVTDPQVTQTLQYIGASQQRTTSGIKAINESLTAEQAHLNMLSEQLSALVEHLNTVENSGTQILRDNAKLAEQLKATQAQMADDNASVAEQLKDLTQMARDNASAAERLKESQEQMAGVIAKGSEETLGPTPLPPPRPTVSPKRKPVAPAQARIQPQSPIRLQRREQ